MVCLVCLRIDSIDDGNDDDNDDENYNDDSSNSNWPTEKAQDRWSSNTINDYRNYVSPYPTTHTHAQADTHLPTHIRNSPKSEWFIVFGDFAKQTRYMVNTVCQTDSFVNFHQLIHILHVHDTRRHRTS